MNCGSGVNGELTMLDILAIISFLISVLNLDENLSQSDKSDLLNNLQEETSVIINEINSHLIEQDEKLNTIIKLLEDKEWKLLVLFHVK